MTRALGCYQELEFRPGPVSKLIGQGHGQGEGQAKGMGKVKRQHVVRVVGSGRLARGAGWARALARTRVGAQDMAGAKAGAGPIIGLGLGARPRSWPPPIFQKCESARRTFSGLPSNAWPIFWLRACIHNGLFLHFLLYLFRIGNLSPVYPFCNSWVGGL